MLRTLVACTAHKVRPFEAEQLEMQSSSSEQSRKNSTTATSISAHTSSTNEDFPSLSEIDGMEPLERHWRDEEARAPSHTVNGEEAGGLRTATHPALESFDHRTAKGKSHNGFWHLRFKEAKQDWEREVLRVDLS